MLNLYATSCYVSAPFCHYVRLPGVVPIRGTFTVAPRPGIIRNALTTFRPSLSQGGWVNRMQLANKGIRSQLPLNENHVYSIVGLNSLEWLSFSEVIPEWTTLELNLSCPNVHQLSIPVDILKNFIKKYQIIVKLSSDTLEKTQLEYEFYHSNGVRNFHLGNTVHTPKGGLSGKRIQKVTLPAITWIRQRDPLSYIIGGGGIYSKKDVQAYREAGADAFSLSTVFVTAPWNVPSIINETKLT